MRLFGYPYNDLVICKDSPDYLNKCIIINLKHNRIPRNPVCAPEICIVEIKNGKYDNEMCELLCTVIITVKKGYIVYIL